MEKESTAAHIRGYNESNQYICRAKEEKINCGEIKLIINKYTYEPSEDSYLLAKTIEDVAKDLSKDLKIFVEIGSGSGYVSVYAFVNVFKEKYPYGILIDISPCAILSSWNSVKMNKIDMYIDVVQCHSAKCLRNTITSLVFFNPPYLPVGDYDIIGIAWSGGVDGIESWKEFFDEALRICLKKLCLIIFIFSTTQNIMEILNKVLDTCNYIEIYYCNEFFYETLCSTLVRC
jgi:methylase of polypeptide subunit release factors